MISVFLYGKRESQFSLLEKSLKKYIMMEDLDVRIDGAFFSSHDLLNSLLRIKKPAIYFLDIDTGAGINGIELAELIRKEDPKSFIIFLGGDPESAVKIINRQMEMVDFVLKNDKMMDGVISALNNAIVRYQSAANNQFKKLTVAVGKKKIMVPLENLIAIIKSERSRKLMIHKTDEAIECNGQIKEIRMLLDENFFQIDRACIININYVAGYDTELDAVIMENNQKYPVSKKCRSKVKCLARGQKRISER